MDARWLIFWAVFLLGLPVQGTIVAELHSVDIATNVLALVVSNGQFDHSHGLEHVIVSWRRSSRSLPFSDFSFSSFARSISELRDYVHNSERAKVLIWARGNCPCIGFSRGAGGAGGNRHCEQNEIASGIEATQVSNGERSRLRQHALKHIWPHERHGIKARSYLSAPLFGHIRKIPTYSTFDGSNFDVRISGYADVVPTGNKRTIIKTPLKSGRDENYLSAKCGNLAYAIVWRRFRPILASENSATISSHGDLVLSEVDYPNASVLNLGRCRITEAGDKPRKVQEPHLILQSNETSMMYGDGQGRTVFRELRVFVSWDDHSWFQVLTTH